MLLRDPLERGLSKYFHSLPLSSSTALFPHRQRFLGLDPVPLSPLVPRANGSGGASALGPEGVRQSLRRQLLPPYGLMECLYGLRWPLSAPRRRLRTGTSAPGGGAGSHGGCRGVAR